MAANYMPKTLAKTLDYIACRAPGEYGLFWDPDGSMPWKELYWALQEDPSLRFVRETHLRELGFLGIPVPFFLDGGLLRLGGDVIRPDYSIVEPPERLYYAFSKRRHRVALEHGLVAPGNRAYLALSSDKEAALRFAKRRDPDPLVAEVRATKAHTEGVIFRAVDSGLYLVERLPADCLVLPPIREEDAVKFAAKKKEKKPSHAEAPIAPGSFFPDLGRMGLGSPPDPEAAAKEKRRRSRKAGTWKKDARGERRKREI